jgi:hypothetical protein
VRTYLAAWKQRENASDDLTPSLDSLLSLYSAAYADMRGLDSQGQAFDTALRVLWDLAGLTHATAVSPAAVQKALGSVGADSILREAAAPADMDAFRQGSGPQLISIDGLPEAVKSVLDAVPAGSGADADGPSCLHMVRDRVKAIYLTTELAQWSPACPMDVCGSSEPLTRTVILAPVSVVDLAPKPAWSLAAVLIHESAHIAWYHSARVSEDPRLLLPVTNERQAWIATANFLRGLQRRGAETPGLLPRSQTADIRKMAAQARTQIQYCNRVLGRTPGDESPVSAIPQCVRESDLRTLSACAPR